MAKPHEHTPREGAADASPADDASGTAVVLDQAAAKLSWLQRSLAIQDHDPWYVGGAKIIAMIITGLLLVALSPLIILGLIVGLAAAV